MEQNPTRRAISSQRTCLYTGASIIAPSRVYAPFPLESLYSKENTTRAALMISDRQSGYEQDPGYECSLHGG